MCFNQANCIASHPLLPDSSHLSSEFCFRRFCTSILRNFCRSHAKPCVCMHACMSLDSVPTIRITQQSHGFAWGELMAKNETSLCFQVYFLILTCESQTSWQLTECACSKMWLFWKCSYLWLYFYSLYRVFVNRSLAMEKIKCFGFDMDYTLAGEYLFLFFVIGLVWNIAYCWAKTSYCLGYSR